MLSDGTKMDFITAGMGGGTGTGAAPVIARVSKELGILTVGIVTIPFKFEGNKKIDQALDGVDEMAKHVDALLVINNERLRKVYPDLSLLNGFAKADDTLSVAAKSIAEIITVRGLINLDFNDVRTVLKDGGVAIMSTGFGEGDGRVRKAIDDALNSPLLNDNDIYNSQKILLSIAFSSENGTDGLAMEEMNEINDFMSRFGSNFELKWGIAIDNTLEKKVKITISPRASASTTWRMWPATIAAWTRRAPMRRHRRMPSRRKPTRSVATDAANTMATTETNWPSRAHTSTSSRRTTSTTRT